MPKKKMEETRLMVDLEILNKEAALLRKNVSDVFLNRNILWIPATTNLETALSIMKGNNIISLPVMDLTQNTCIGVVDVLDIASFLVAKFPIDSITPENLKNLEYSGTYFGREVPVVQVINFSKTLTPTHQGVPAFVELSTPLLGLIDIFAQGIHRVPVVDRSTAKLLNFISQSDLLRYFAENMYLIGDTAYKTIQNLGLVGGGVHFCKVSAPVIGALLLIVSKRVSAIPALDDSGVLRGTISASDLRGLGPEDFPNLMRPVFDYLASKHPKSLFPLTCTPDDTLEYAIMKMAATKVHRLWCIDKDRKILGIVSITDVMKSYIQAPMEISPTFSYLPNTQFGDTIKSTPLLSFNTRRISIE